MRETLSGVCKFELVIYYTPLPTVEVRVILNFAISQLARMPSLGF